MIARLGEPVVDAVLHPQPCLRRFVPGKAENGLLHVFHIRLGLRAQGHADLPLSGRDPEIPVPEPDSRDCAETHGLRVVICGLRLMIGGLRAMVSGLLVIIGGLQGLKGGRCNGMSL